MAACTKTFSAFTCCCCTSQANYDQQNSQPQQNSNPSLLIHDHAHKAHHDHNQNRIDDNSEGANAKQFTDKRQHHASQPHGKDQKSELVTSDDPFSHYISRAKVKQDHESMTMNVRCGNK
ncbi:hypothetical protein ACLB2K_011892 [Fragaria x ananassa]